MLWCRIDPSAGFYLLFKLKCSKNIANIISPNLTSSCVFLVAGGGGGLDVHPGGVCYVVLSLLPWDNHSRQWCLPVTTQSHQSAYPSFFFDRQITWSKSRSPLNESRLDKNNKTGTDNKTVFPAWWLSYTFGKYQPFLDLADFFLFSLEFPSPCYNHMLHTQIKRHPLFIFTALLNF